MPSRIAPATQDNHALYETTVFDYLASRTGLTETEDVRHRDVSQQYQPWLKTVEKTNLGALVDRPPYVYWYRFREALELLDRAGLRVIWAGSTAQIGGRAPVAGDPHQLDPSALGGMLYVACRRM